MSELNNNISFFLEEKDDDNDKNNEEEINKKITEFLGLNDNELNNPKDTQNVSCYDNMGDANIDYAQNNFNKLYYQYQGYSVKDLLKICNYYEIDKHIRIAKLKKTDIIDIVVYFESLSVNMMIVKKRRRMWSYMTELLLDSKMKKYIIWN